MNEQAAKAIKGFGLPDYYQIPDVGLYLEQVVRYLCDCLDSLSSISITGSMVSNYVKKRLITNPVKKQYSREQIAYLMFIAIAKTVLSLEDIQLLIRLQKKTYSTEVAYQYLAREFENVLHYVFGLKDELEAVGVDDTEEKAMLRNTIITVAHKIYLDKCFEIRRQNEEEQTKTPAV